MNVCCASVAFFLVCVFSTWRNSPLSEIQPLVFFLSCSSCSSCFFPLSFFHSIFPFIQGLAVDYSAHIAHMFVESTGTAPQRAIKALTRIGPSVFNAVLSTLAAVIIIGFSNSYVFRVFFKALFLTVLIGGAHGLLFLPAILSLFGGDRAARNEMAPVKTAAVADDSPRNDDKKVVEMVAQDQEEDQKLPEVTV